MTDVTTRDHMIAGDTPTAPFASLRGMPDWIIEHLESDRVCWAILGMASVVSVLLLLWLTRGITFHTDDFLYFVGNRGFHPRVLLGPHNGHLILVPRLIYAVFIKIFGPRHYVVLRLVEALGIVFVAVSFFALAKRNTTPAVALGPSVLLLFLGSTWQDSLDPVGIAHVYCIAAGVAAMLALDRDSGRADVAACVLLLVSVASFTVGLAFLAGAAVSILLRRDRWKRAWIFLLPLAMYGLWLLSPRLSTPPFSTSTGATLANVLVIPNYIADAAAAVAAALSGLSYNFSNPASYTIDSPWGYVIATIAAAALVIRLRRGRVPVSLWASLTILFCYWALTALVAEYTREPNQNRYVYDGAVIVLLVAVNAVRGIRLPRVVPLVVVAATIVSLMTNIALLRAGSNYLRASGPSDRAMLAAIEIARDHVSPSFVPQGEPLLTFVYPLAGGTGSYLAAVHRNGSFAFTVTELRQQSERVRELADANLGSALQLRLVPAPPPRSARSCLQVGAQGSRPLDLAVRPPGLLLRSSVSAAVALRRFASFPTVRLGELPARGFFSLNIPPDRAPDPWHLVVSGGQLTVCALGATP